MTRGNPERLHGTLELLILQLLSVETRNGYSLGREIRERTEQELIVDEGSLYPALYRMQRRGWLAAKWGRSENNRRAKFYRLTLAGRAQLDKERADWSSFSAAVERILESA